MAKKKQEQVNNETEENKFSLDSILSDVFDSVKTLSDEDDDLENLPKDYFDTGHYLLNVQLSGKFDGGVPDNRFTVFSGDKASGKSFMVKNIMKNAIDMGYTVLHFDTEGELDLNDLKQHNIDCSKVKVAVPEPYSGMSKEDKYALELGIWTVDLLKNKLTQLVKIIPAFPKLVIVIDSLSALCSRKEVNDAVDNKNKEDMTRYKKLKQMFKILTKPAKTKHIPIIGVAHVYQTHDLFSKTVSSTGSGVDYAASIHARFSPSKLYNKDKSEVLGFTTTSMLEKGRLSRPFSKIKFTVKYKGGLQKYSGLLEYGEKLGLYKLVKGGSKGKCIQLKDSEEKLALKDLNVKDFFDNLLFNKEFGEKLNEYFRFSSVDIESNEIDIETDDENKNEND